MLLRLALALADRVATALPVPAAYWLADLGGDLWRRLAPERRRLVRANLARVCVATGRAASGPAFDALVRDAFRNHARYYLELLRGPHYDRARIATIVDVPEWPAYEAALRGGPTLLVSSHLGNFEPFGTFLVAQGYRPVAPIEEIEPRALFEFLAERRGGSSIDLVPLSESRAVLSRRLREGGAVGVIGDRLIGGGRGQQVEVFGHPVEIPTGPATLAVTFNASVIVGRCLRTGRERFQASGDVVLVPATGDRRADVAALTERIASRFERDIGAAPEQWWGAFQPFWPDLPGRS
jgi:lauroyl/myristoyl acyltransferase